MKKTVAMRCAARMRGAPLASVAHPGSGPDGNHGQPPAAGQRPRLPQPELPPAGRHAGAAPVMAAPPHGHRWLSVNGDDVLVAIASGVIVNILAGY